MRRATWSCLPAKFTWNGIEPLRTQIRFLGLLRIAFAALLILLSAPIGAVSGHEPEKIVWKPVADAQLKLDGKPLKTWNVYLGEKKKYLVLIQLVRRFLLIDTKARGVYEVKPEDLTGRGKDLESDLAAAMERPIPSSDWIVRDVGPAELVRVRLGDYGRVVEVQLPHMPDLRWVY